MKPIVERLRELWTGSNSPTGLPMYRDDAFAQVRAEGYRLRNKTMRQAWREAKYADHAAPPTPVQEGVTPAAPAPAVEVVPAFKGDPVEALYGLLKKRKEAGITLTELIAFPEGTIKALEARGASIGFKAGNITLERDPRTKVSDDAITGIFDPTKEWHKIGILSDSHFGGIQAQPWFVRQFQEESARRGCVANLHVGDILDGPPSMHVGFVYELVHHRIDAQVDSWVQVAKESQVPWWAIGGNHDGAWFKVAGIDALRMIEERMPGNFHNIGPIQGWVEGPNGDPNFIRMFHPGDGCSYALSYKDQKTAEHLVLQNSKVPTGFHFTGHYHKQNIMRGPNGAKYFLVPSSCSITDFMLARRLTNQSGALFLEFTLDKAGRVDQCRIEDVPLWPDQWKRCDYSEFKRTPRRHTESPWE